MPVSCYLLEIVIKPIPRPTTVIESSCSRVVDSN